MFNAGHIFPSLISANPYQERLKSLKLYPKSYRFEKMDLVKILDSCQKIADDCGLAAGVLSGTVCLFFLFGGYELIGKIKDYYHGFKQARYQQEGKNLIKDSSYKG